MKTTKQALALLVAMAIIMIGAYSAKSEVTQNISVPLDGFSVFVPCANNGAGELVIFREISTYCYRLQSTTIT